MSEELPPPKPTRPMFENEIYGLGMIVPIYLEGYHEGYNSVVYDDYDANYVFDDNGNVDYSKSLLVFTQRRRSFSKPQHYGYDGKPWRCEECEKWWAIYPDKDDKDEILIRESDPPPRGEP